MTKHGVLSDLNGYYAIDTEQEHIVQYDLSIAHFHAAMQGQKIDVLWAMPNCHFSNTVRREHFEELEGKRYHAYVPQHLVHNKIYGALVHDHRATQYNVPDTDRYFMFPGNREWKVPMDKDKGIWDVRTPQELLHTVELLEARYHVPLLWSPGFVGWEYFLSLHRDRVFPVQPLNEAQGQEFDVLGREIIQHQGYAALEQEGEYVHGFDKNGQFLGAAQSVELGSGPYSYEQEYQPKSCGLWKYSLGNDARYFPGIPSKGIASTDLLNALHAMGYWTTVYDGIVWGTHKKYLYKWAIDMWDARQHFIMEGAVHPLMDDIYAQERILRNCASTAKMIPNSMIGTLVRKGYPHWNRLIVHKAMANQIYTIRKVERYSERRPVLVSRDSLYYTSDNPDPYKAFPWLLEHEHEQRGYKLLGTCKMNDEIKHAFTRANDRRFGVGGIEGVIKRSMDNA